jgi:hypothetical protein
MIFGRCLRQRLVVIVGLLAQLASEKPDAELLRCALSRLQGRRLPLDCRCMGGHHDRPRPPDAHRARRYCRVRARADQGPYWRGTKARASPRRAVRAATEAHPASAARGARPPGCRRDASRDRPHLQRRCQHHRTATPARLRAHRLPAEGMGPSFNACQGCRKRPGIHRRRLRPRANSVRGYSQPPARPSTSTGLRGDTAERYVYDLPGPGSLAGPTGRQVVPVIEHHRVSG